MIIEAIVSSVDGAGRVNLAPMGPTVDEQWTRQTDGGGQIILRPFRTSRTYQNLVGVRRAVVHVTDDVLLFARAAVDAISESQTRSLVEPVDGTDCWRLIDCHRWLAVQVESVGGDDLRAELTCRVTQSGMVRPFFGFNRAKHAVIEAAILATRTHLIDPELIHSDLDRLRPWVEKTAGAVEREAFELLCVTIDERIAKNGVGA